MVRADPQVKMRHRIDGERGVSAILVAASLLLLLSMTALALDGGMLYGERRSAQNAADHAALASAFAACGGATEANAIIAGETAATRNGFDPSDPDYTVTVTRLGPVDAYRYQAVVVTRAVDATFGAVVGAGNLPTQARAVAYCERNGGGDYALFASATTCNDEITWNANDVDIDGKIHSNGDITVVSNNGEVLEGETTYSDAFSDTGVNNQYEPPPFMESPKTLDPIDLSQYAPAAIGTSGTMADEANTLGQYYSFVGNQNFSGALAPGVYFVAGQLRIDNNLTVNPAGAGQIDGITFVATQRIEVTGNNTVMSFWRHPDNRELLLGTPYDAAPACGVLAVDIRGNNHDWQGIVYAPNGTIATSGNLNSPSLGAFWAYQMTLTGQNFELQFPNPVVASEPLVELYE